MPAPLEKKPFRKPRAKPAPFVMPCADCVNLDASIVHLAGVIRGLRDEIAYLRAENARLQPIRRAPRHGRPF